MIKKLALLLWYECNNNCRFCYCADKRGKWEMSTEQAKKELAEGLERGCSFVDFNGGEPSLRKDIFELVAHAKKLGYGTIALTSNGRMFHYRDFCSRITEAGLNHVVLSVHGHTPELHDYMTRSTGSYQQVTRGMKNIRESKPDIYICTNTVITRMNYRFLPEIAENNIRLGADACEFIFVHPRGEALRNFEQVVPTLTEASPFIQATLDAGKKRGISHFTMRYLPMCFIMSSPDSLSEFKARKFMEEQHVGPEFRDLEVARGRELNGRAKGPHCSFCRLSGRCEGIFKEYAERRGFGELIPVA